MSIFVFIFCVINLIVSEAYNPFIFNSKDPCSRHCYYDYHVPVCGSNHVTYFNECVMKVYACWSKVDISVAYQGKCYPKEIDSTQKCEFRCPELVSPVCGTDERTYNNECLLQQNRCYSQNIGLKKQHDGFCLTKNSYTAACGTRISLKFQPVCGTNGVSYINKDTLSKTACHKLDLNLRVHAFGECGRKRRSRKRCRSAMKKEFIYKPVCGSDSNTHESVDVLKYRKCLERSSRLTVMHKGECSFKDKGDEENLDEHGPTESPNLKPLKPRLRILPPPPPPTPPRPPPSTRSPGKTSTRTVSEDITTAAPIGTTKMQSATTESPVKVTTTVYQTTYISTTVHQVTDTNTDDVTDANVNKITGRPTSIDSVSDMYSKGVANTDGVTDAKVDRVTGIVTESVTDAPGDFSSAYTGGTTDVNTGVIPDFNTDSITVINTDGVTDTPDNVTNATKGGLTDSNGDWVNNAYTDDVTDETNTVTRNNTDSVTDTNIDGVTDGKTDGVTDIHIGDVTDANSTDRGFDVNTVGAADINTDTKTEVEADTNTNFSTLMYMEFETTSPENDITMEYATQSTISDNMESNISTNANTISVVTDDSNINANDDKHIGLRVKDLTRFKNVKPPKIKDKSVPFGYWKPTPSSPPFKKNTREVTEILTESITVEILPTEEDVMIHAGIKDSKKSSAPARKTTKEVDKLPKITSISTSDIKIEENQDNISTTVAYVTEEVTVFDNQETTKASERDGR